VAGLFEIDQFIAHAREGLFYQIKQTQNVSPQKTKKKWASAHLFLSFQPLAAGPTKAAVDVTFVNYEIINDQGQCRNDRVRQASKAATPSPLAGREKQHLACE